MNNPKIVSIVEGYGEVQAVPELLRRIIWELGHYDIEIDGKPIREHRGNLANRPEKLKSSVEAAASRIKDASRGCILIIFDADDDCPKELAPNILKFANETRSDMYISVVLPKVEYEAWLAASVETLVENISESAKNRAEKPEDIKDPKGFLRSVLGPYHTREDQVRYTARFDMQLARERCPSFDKLWRDMESFFHQIENVE